MSERRREPDRDNYIGRSLLPIYVGIAALTVVFAITLFIPLIGREIAYDAGQVLAFVGVTLSIVGALVGTYFAIKAASDAQDTAEVGKDLTLYWDVMEE